MKWREACKASLDGRAIRTTDNEQWVIVDPDTNSIVYDITGYSAVRLPEEPNAATEVFKLTVGPEGVEYEKIRWAFMKEMDQHEDWVPRKPIPRAGMVKQVQASLGDV